VNPAPDDSPRHPGRPGALSAALGSVTLALFGWLAARHAFLGDDAFISFRYARNLVEGHGLVFNPGEHVEGYTNFLWTLLMALVMRLGLSPETTANVLGIAAGTALLVVVAWLGARSRGWSDPLVWVAPLALATNRTFVAWSTGGLETQLFSLLLFVGLVRFGIEREREASRPAASALLLAAATLTRPEGVLVFAVAATVFVVDVAIRRRRSAVSLAAWLTVYAVVVGSHLAFRLAYYGDLLPNTFHAKVSGLWWEQSSLWLGHFVRDYRVWLFGWLALVPLVRRRGAHTVLFASVLGVYLAYLAYVGGDIFEFRFLAPLLPYLYWLVQEATWVIADGSRPEPSGATRVVAAAAVGLVVVGVAFPPALSTEPWRRDGIASTEAVAAYAAQRAEEGRVLRELVEEGYLAGDELIAVGGAGALPYYAELPTLDFRGLNDRTIARQEVTERGIIGHEKFASMEYLTERGVVIYDVLNRIVHPAGSPAIGARGVDRPIYSGPLRCVEADGRFLVFATTLDDAAFRQRFSRFRILY
jgi:arabinofuranosyltransferase